MCHRGGRGREHQEWSKAQKTGRGVEGWSCLRFSFYIVLDYSDSIGNKLISLSQVCFANDSNWWVISSPPFIDPRTFPCVSSTLPGWGEEWEFGGHLVLSPGQPHRQSTRSAWHRYRLQITLGHRTTVPSIVGIFFHKEHWDKNLKWILIVFIFPVLKPK